MSTSTLDKSARASGVRDRGSAAPCDAGALPPGPPTGWTLGAATAFVNVAEAVAASRHSVVRRAEAVDA